MNSKRTAALVALGVVVLAVAVILLRSGGDSYTVTAEVDNASQLIKGNDVRIGSAKVGKVTGVNITGGGTAEIEMEIDEETAPLPEGTSLAVRSYSLFGLANRFVVLQPPSGPSEPLADGATIGIQNTTSLVESDALFDTFDAKTRRGLQQLFEGGATVLDGRAEEANETLTWLGPTFEGSSIVLGELAKDQDAFAGLLNEAAITARAVNSRRDDLVSLISNANITTKAIGDQSVALERTLGQLPDTLRRSNSTFVAVRGALDELDPFWTATKTGTKDLAKFLGNTRPFLKRAKVALPDFATVVKTKRKNDDFTDFFRNMPPLANAASRGIPDLISFMSDFDPTLDNLRAYSPDIFGALGNLSDVNSHYDANGHYARGLPVLGASTYDSGLNVIDPWTTGTDRLTGFELNAGARCPGGAMQPPGDGSAPIAVAGCNPLLTPPGP